MTGEFGPVEVSPNRERVFQQWDRAAGTAIRCDNCGCLLNRGYARGPAPICPTLRGRNVNILRLITERRLPLYRDVEWKGGYGGKLKPADSLLDAEAVGSLRPDGTHDVLIDIDVEAHLIPSSTPGHAHLYVPLGCSWEDYQAFLDAAARIGLVEPGYAAACIALWGQTTLRLPWIEKGREKETTLSAKPVEPPADAPNGWPFR